MSAALFSCRLPLLLWFSCDRELRKQTARQLLYSNYSTGPDIKTAVKRRYDVDMNVCRSSSGLFLQNNSHCGNNNWEWSTAACETLFSRAAECQSNLLTQMLEWKAKCYTTQVLKSSVLTLKHTSEKHVLDKAAWCRRGAGCTATGQSNIINWKSCATFCLKTENI